MTALDYKLEEDRKQLSTKVTAEQHPARKKMQLNKELSRSASSKIVVEKEDQQKTKRTDTREQRCLSGDVGQVRKLNQTFPNLDAIYEVYGKISQ